MVIMALDMLGTILIMFIFYWPCTDWICPFGLFLFNMESDNYLHLVSLYKKYMILSPLIIV